MGERTRVLAKLWLLSNATLPVEQLVKGFLTKKATLAVLTVFNTAVYSFVWRGFKALGQS
ncbi:hypothetical protein N9X06_03785 [Paracoccaceae bacterium]|nr:hypothetical protein [Paracoccaceae bacterium]